MSLLSHFMHHNGKIMIFFLNKSYSPQTFKWYSACFSPFAFSKQAKKMLNTYHLPRSVHTSLQFPLIFFLPVYMIYLHLCRRRSIRECANEICSFRTEALHEQFCLHLHLLYCMREMETNAFGLVPQTHTEHSTCKLCHWQTETSNFCKWLSWQGHFCSVSFLAASFSGHRSEAVVALDTAAPSTVVETERVCVCVCDVLCWAPLQDNRAGWSLPHLSPESPTPDVEWRGTASDGELTLNHTTFHLLCLGFIGGLICNITPFALTDEPAVILKAGRWHKGLKLLQPACNI